MYLEMMEMIKGKRTKRQRPVSPLSLAVTSSLRDGDRDSFDERERISSNMVSASSSSEFAESVGEEEDMANCLILLANSHHQTRKLLEPSGITSNTKESSLCAYECKTCNRRFPSFQALGGHRASHKKPNKGSHEEKKAVGPVGSVMEQEQEDQFNAMSTILSLHIPNRVVCNNSIKNTIKTNKVHECSICGSEFSSGQALGGHMRRHRAFTSTSTTNMSLVSSSPESHESKKPRNSLDLDLNLPAPEDDLQDNKFHFSSKEHVLVFNMSSLVDCHY